jgi:hypothetical protein
LTFGDLLDPDGLSGFQTREGRLRAIDELESLPDRFHVARVEADPNGDVDALLEELDSVVVVPPREDGARLMMGDIAPATKGGSRELYRRLRDDLRRVLPLRTRATNVVTGGSDVYPDVWASSGALAAQQQGLELRQEGVENVVFRPEAR